MAASNPIGSIGGTSQAWAYLNSYLTAIGPTYIPGLVETNFKKHVLLGRLKANNRVRTYEEGGHGIIKRLAIGENPTIMFRGPKADPDVQFNEFTTQAYWGWGTLTGSLTFWDDDINKCRGKAQLLDFVDPQVKQAVNTIAKRISWALGQGATGRTDDTTMVAPGAATTDLLLGLRDGVSDISGAPYPTTYGGLNPHDNTNLGSWYANSYDNSANGGVGKLVKTMEHVANLCVHGMFPLEFVISDQAGAELYAEQLYPNVRYTNLGDNSKGETVFEGYTFRNMPVMWDVDVKPFVTAEVPSTGWSGTADTASTSRFYFIAPESMSWWWNPVWNERNAISPEWRYPERGFRRSKQIALQSQFVVEDRRSNGLLYNVVTS